MSFVSKVKALVERFDHDHYGWAPLTRPLSMDIYCDWIDKNQQASMEYLRKHAQTKAEPQRLAPRARSAIVIAKRYLPHPYGTPASKLNSVRTALYAKGDDYHFGFKRELEKLADSLRADFPEEEFLCFTDSAPILERDLAYRAGLGWIGKNTCLIHPKKGSLFFLGQILTSLAIDEASPAPIADACGTCRRCLDACPTQALEAPRWLNANKCISFWTIESRQAAPPEMRASLGDWFFGCDICQTVCPWNEKNFGREFMQKLTHEQGGREAILSDLRWLLGASHREITRQLAGSPLLRARPLGLKRNALVIIGNRRLHELHAEVEQARQSTELKEVADWALAQLA